MKERKITAEDLRERFLNVDKTHLGSEPTAMFSIPEGYNDDSEEIIFFDKNNWNSKQDLLRYIGLSIWDNYGSHYSFKTNASLKTIRDNSISNTNSFTFKGCVDYSWQLPIENVSYGDVYIVKYTSLDDNTKYMTNLEFVYDGKEWKELQSSSFQASIDIDITFEDDDWTVFIIYKDKNTYNIYIEGWYKNRGRTEVLTKNGRDIELNDYLDIINILIQDDKLYSFI